MYVDIYVNVDMYVTLKCNVCEYVDGWMKEIDEVWTCGYVDMYAWLFCNQ